MNFDSIPEPLKENALWCLWKREQRQSKYTKVPYNPRTGGKAQSNNPQTFSDFKTARTLYERGGYDGMGIGIFKPFAAIDIDHCVEGGKLTPLAVDIVAHLNSYSEYSPSGTGIRILFTVKGDFSYDKERYYINNQARGLEVYVSGSTQKFVTITGVSLKDSAIVDAGESLNYVCATYMQRKQEKKPKSKSKETAVLVDFDKWFKIGMQKDPHLSEYWQGIFQTDNESEKDACLMARLLYWCNCDIQVAIEYFKQSPFAQLKDEEHTEKINRPDYLERTAKNVMPDKTAQGDNTAYQETKRDFAILHRTPKNELLQIVLQAIKPHSKYAWNDKGFSELFADVYRDFCRYNVTAREWYFFDGRVWQADISAMRVSQKAKELTDALIIFSTTIDDEKQKTDYQKKIADFGQLRFRDTMIKDARDKYFINPKDLDADLDLFNCQNGTLNLSTGEFKPHKPQDLLSKCSNVVFDPDIRSPLWERFICEVMLGDLEKIEYLQKILGYALTAETKLETCWILYGSTTRNGKSTLVETFAYVLGNSSGYALAMQPQTLAQRQNKDSRTASGDIARLDGCRFLNASEPPKRMIFDVALLKTLLGRDTITARHLYEKEYEYTPHFKLFINTNFLPIIQDDSLFSSGRINIITFDKHFSSQEQDHELKDKLRSPENVCGILNWCLDGLRNYRQNGLNLPDSIIQATAQYRQSCDKTGNFIGECLEKTGKNSRASSVYQIYSQWCESNGFGVENKSNFFDELKNKGLFSESGTVAGVSARNIVRGYEIIKDEFLSSSTGEFFPAMQNMQNECEPSNISPNREVYI